MKSIGSAFDNFDLVVNSLQPPRMDGISTMIDNAIGISDKGFREADEWFDPTLKGNHAPARKCFDGPARVPVLPEPLQIILQDVSGAQCFIQFEQGLEVWSFLISQVLTVLQKQVFTSLHDLLSRIGSVVVLEVSDLVDHPSIGSHDVKLVEDNLRLRAALAYCLDVRVPHVHGNRFDMRALFLGKRGKETLQALCTSAFACPKHSSTLPIGDDGHVAVSLSNRYLINNQYSWGSPLLMGILLLKESFVNLLHRLPVKTQMLGNLFDAHVSTKLQHIGGKTPTHSPVWVNKGKRFHHHTTVRTPKFPIGQRYKTAYLKEIQIPDRSSVIGVYLLHLCMAAGADGNVSFIGVGLNAYYVLSCIYLLIHNLYSTKSVKRANLDFGHRLSPGHVFAHKTSYPVKIAVSIIYARLLATNMEKNQKY